MSLEVTISRYVKAWNMPNDLQRMDLLSQALAPDARYAGPDMDLIGLDRINAMIGEFTSRAPRVFLERTSLADAHTDFIQFTWSVVETSGAVRMSGITFGEVAAETRQLQCVVVFHGPPPALR